MLTQKHVMGDMLFSKYGYFFEKSVSRAKMLHVEH
jgi:hypothetical protein